MTPLWFPHAHDHRSKLPSQWSTWEEGNFSTPNPTWQIWSRCCKASDPNNKIQLGCNWLEAYSVRDTFKGHNIALNHRVMNSTGNAPEKLTLSDTTFTRDSLALNHGVRNSTANVPNRDAPMEQTHSRTLLLDTELFISRLPDNKKDSIAPNHGVRGSAGNVPTKHIIGHLLDLSPWVIYVGIIHCQLLLYHFKAIDHSNPLLPSAKTIHAAGSHTKWVGSPGSTRSAPHSRSRSHLPVGFCLASLSFLLAFPFACALLLAFAPLIFAVWTTSGRLPQIGLELFMVWTGIPMPKDEVGEPPGPLQQSRSHAAPALKQRWSTGASLVVSASGTKSWSFHPYIDQGKRSSLRLDELGDVDRKLPDVQENTAVAHEDFRVADGTKTNLVAISSFSPKIWDFVRLMTGLMHPASLISSMPPVPSLGLRY